MRRSVVLTLALCLVALAATSPPVAAQQPYQANDYGGFRNIYTPGERGFFNGAEYGAYALNGAKPAHVDDQLRMYEGLVWGTPGMQEKDIGKYFKDASFGVKPEDVERTYSPRGGVTIQRDKFGIPHIYGQTRYDTMFGTGYATAEDRLLEMDILRHVGRGNATSYLAPLADASGNDKDTWDVAPYTEADLQRQIDSSIARYGAEGQQVRDDANAYVDGVNKYISEARSNPLKLDGAYAAINPGRLGPDNFHERDIIAIAGLVGGIFGKGGGNEVDSALILQAARKRFGDKKGTSVWADFRSAEDPEHSTIVHKRAFPYEVPPKKRAKGSLALPDPGTLRKYDVQRGLSRPEPAPTTESRIRAEPQRGKNPRIQQFLDGLRRVGPWSSNALVVAASKSKSGKPLAVFGPQTAYQSPSLLYEQDVHGPGIDARGVAFAGTNVYVQLGRGRDYAWSATSAGQDIIDTFALELCEPSGAAPTIHSMHYRYKGKCEPIEVLTRSNAGLTGGPTYKAERTKLGLATARATVGGKPVVYTKLRSTYFHEIDPSAAAFMKFNNPDAIHNAQEFQQAAFQVGYTFNWFYADNRDVAYFNSGNNPVRAKGVDPNFPTHGDFPWQNWDGDAFLGTYSSFRSHPRIVNGQDFLADWNGKQAKEYRAADDNWNYTSTYRSNLLRGQIEKRIAGKRKIDLPGLIDAMGEGGGMDLRGYKDLPAALRMIGPVSKVENAKVRDAIGLLKEWNKADSIRRDRNRDGVYEHSRAIEIMDAWWPLWVRGQFEPVLGKDLYNRIVAIKGGIDNDPNNHGAHLGSAYQSGFYGNVRKDLRTILGERVKGKYSRGYCGGGNKAECRAMLLRTLEKAISTPTSETYGHDAVCDDQPTIGPSDPKRRAHNQWCWDSILHMPVGLVNLPLTHWINRPTFQQANEIQGHRPR